MNMTTNSTPDTKDTNTLHVRIYVDASFEADVEVPKGLTLEEAGEFAEKNIQELIAYTGQPLEVVPGTEEIDPEDLHNGHTYFA